MEREKTWGALLAAAIMMSGCGEQTAAVEVIEQAPGAPGGIEIDGTYVYWTSTYAGGAVMRAPISSGEEPLSADDMAIIKDPQLSVDLELVGDKLFFVRRPTETAAANGALMEAGKSGGSGTAIVSTLRGPTDLVVSDSDSAVIFLVDTDEGNGTATGGIAELLRVAGGTTDVIGGGQGRRVGGLAVGQDYLAWTEIDLTKMNKEQSGAVWRWRIDGTETVSLVSGSENQPRGVALAGDVIVWATLGSDTGTGGAIRRLDPSTGAIEDIATGQNIGASGRILVDGDDVYWFNVAGGTDHELRRASVAGGSSVLVASARGAPQDLVADSTRIYWTVLEGFETKVLAIAK